jgi:hypothetical protein
MADTRPTYKPSQDAQDLIDRIIAARPLDRVSATDAINYALRYTIEHDPEMQRSAPLYHIQHTGYPVGAGDPEPSWKTTDEVETLNEAERIVSDYKREMHDRCGPSAWDDQFRIIASRNTQVTYRLTCLGPVIGQDRWCKHNHIVTMTLDWPSGASMPVPEIPPAGWHSLTQCTECHTREQIEIAREESGR